MSPILNYLLTALSIGMTFLFGCTGDILTEKVGHLNLGIPGIMCMGGAGGCFALSLMYKSGMNPMLIVFLALLATFLTGALMGMLYCFLTVSLKANQNVTGLAMTTFGVGTMKFIMSQWSGMGKSIRYLYAREYFRFPFGDRKDSLVYCGFMLLLAIAIALIVSFVLHRTKIGLHIRAVGENPATADAAGIRVSLYKYAATCIGSGIAAIGGIYYIMVCSGSPEAYKSIEPLGWLSIALVIFTLWKPHISILGAIVFGLLYVAGSFVPTLLGWNLPMYATYLFQMLPYVVTIVVLIVTSIRKKRENQPPASLGLPYFREER